MHNSVAFIFHTIFTWQLGCAGRWYLANDENPLKHNFENYVGINKSIPLQITPTILPSDYKLSRSADDTHKLQLVTNEKHNKTIENEIISKYGSSEIVINSKKDRTRKTFNQTQVIGDRFKSDSFKPTKNAHVRFLEIFEVVSFNHIQCVSTNGLEGTCLHEYECLETGGKAMGLCADGYGACCVVQYSCDNETKAKIGWFTSPGFPLPSIERLSCTVVIHKMSPDVKQIRLDFLSFELHAPTYGNCEYDQFIVTGQNVNNIIPILCGINTGQHVYVEVGNIDGSLSLSVQTITAETRVFSIKVTQIRPGHDLAAPTGCLQYYKGEQGYIESMNYRDRSEIELGNIQSYLNNLNYAMCIERDKDACSITYTNAGNMQIVNYDTDGLPVIPPKQAGVEIFNCPSDWLLISAVRLCGERLNDGSVLQDFSLNAPVTDDGVGPIVIWFRSDSVHTGRGFRLHYKQISCSDTPLR